MLPGGLVLELQGSSPFVRITEPQRIVTGTRCGETVTAHGPFVHCARNFEGKLWGMLYLIHISDNICYILSDMYIYQREIYIIYI